MQIQKIINKGDELIDTSEKDFLKSVKGAETTLYKEISKLFSFIDTKNGKLQNSEKARKFLLTLDSRITDALYKSSYKPAVINLIKSFDSIAQNNIDLQSSLNKENILFSQINSIKELEVNNTLDKLLGNGLSKDFISPIRETLYRNLMTSASVEETQLAIKDFLITTPEKDSKLLKYADQIGRDSIMQFDGSIQQNISSELGLKDYLYVGSIIVDSRGQCVHWANKSNLKSEELENEIKTALKGGSLSGKKCSGMNPFCSVNTFSIYRGGYRCRHRAIATIF